MIQNGFNDRKRAIYQIQSWLRTLSATGLPIPSVVPDGIYDEKTREAVGIFQGLSGINPTGSVDYLTWLALRDDYRKAVASSSRSLPIYPFESPLSEGDVRLGDSFPLVYILQAMIEELSSVYVNVEQQKRSGIFDEQTADNVKRLQQVWQLPITGTVNKETWNMLAEAYNKNVTRE